MYNNTPVFLNGKLIGLYENPAFLFKHIKLLKLNSIINVNTSISWNIKTNELHIFTDSGRIICSPVFYLKSDPEGNKYNELISKLFYIETWSKAIHGLLYNIEEITPSVYDTKYYKEILDNIKQKEDDFMRYLETNAHAEYIDSIESENAFISKDIYSIDKNYTHFEIHCC